MEIGVQTKGIYPERNAKQALQMIRNAGFTNIDFNIDAFLLNTDVYAGRINSFFDQDIEELKRYFHPMKECMKQYGICASQMHAPYPVMIQGREEQNRFMMEQVIPKSLAIASYLEIEWVVVHPIKLQYNAGIQKEREENMKFFQTLIPLLEKYHVKICLENLYESVGQRIAEGVCANPADAIAYIDKLNELDTTGVEPMSHVFPVENVMREDVVTNGDGSEATLANAPERKEDAFVVPKTVD